MATIEGLPGLFLGLGFPAKIGVESPDGVLVVTLVTLVVIVVHFGSLLVELCILQEVPVS